MRPRALLPPVYFSSLARWVPSQAKVHLQWWRGWEESHAHPTFQPLGCKIHMLYRPMSGVGAKWRTPLSRRTKQCQDGQNDIQALICPLVVCPLEEMCLRQGQ